MADEHLVALEEKDFLELPPRQLMALVQLPLLQFPQGRFAGSQQLLFLLQELTLEKGNLLAVAIAEAPQRRLVALVQTLQELALPLGLLRFHLLAFDPEDIFTLILRHQI